MDVDIGGLGIELVSIPNQSSIDIRFQYQSDCLNVDEIARWNQRSRRIPILVWMSIPWHLILAVWPSSFGVQLPRAAHILLAKGRGTRRGGRQGRGAYRASHGGRRGSGAELAVRQGRGGAGLARRGMQGGAARLAGRGARGSPRREEASRGGAARP